MLALADRFILMLWMYWLKDTPLSFHGGAYGTVDCGTA
jgi:hypothetical protein